MGAVVELMDEEWNLVEAPLRPARPSRRRRARSQGATSWTRSSGSPGRLPVAATSRPVPRLAGCREPVAAVARQGDLGSGDARARAGDPAPPQPQGRPHDGDDRRPDREGRARRPDLPRGRRTGRLHARGEADDPDRDPRAAARRVGRVGQATRRPVARGKFLKEQLDPKHTRAARPPGDRRRPRLQRASPRSPPATASTSTSRRRPRRRCCRPRSPAGSRRKGKRVFTPLRPLYKVENAFARLGMWRRLSRCYEQTALGAQTWLEVACVAYLCGRLLQRCWAA